MSTPRHRTGKVSVNEILPIVRMLTSLKTTGSSDAQLSGMVLGLSSHSSLRFLFEELDMLMGAAALTGAGTMMATMLVDFDAMEVAMMDMLTVGVVFLNGLLVLMRFERAGCEEENFAKPSWSGCSVECLVRRKER